MAEYNRPAMVEFIYGTIQDKWPQGKNSKSYMSLYTAGKNFMSEEFGGIDLNNPNRGGGLYSKDDFNKLSAGDYLALPDWSGAYMLVAERLDNAIVVVTPTATTFRWKVYTWEQLDVIRQKSDSNSLGSRHIEFNEL